MVTRMRIPYREPRPLDMATKLQRMRQVKLTTLAANSSLVTVGIIGSAGRKADAKKMTQQIFNKMLAKAKELITQNFKLDLSQVHLVSGGAAWAGGLSPYS